MPEFHDTHEALDRIASVVTELQEVIKVQSELIDVLTVAAYTSGGKLSEKLVMGLEHAEKGSQNPMAIKFLEGIRAAKKGNEGPFLRLITNHDSEE